MVHKKLVICFCLTVYVDGKVSEEIPEAGEMILELECEDFTFLPPIGTYCSFLGFEALSGRFIVKEYGMLMETATMFSMDITLRDKDIRKDYIPEFSVLDVQRAIESGWKIAYA